MNAVSLDSRTELVDVDLGLFYGLAADLQAEAHLTGADTMLVAGDADTDDQEYSVAEPGPAKPRSILVVTDSRGRARGWRVWRRSGYWSTFVSLCSRSTPPEHLGYLRRAGVDVIVAGDRRVDLRSALDELARRYGVRSVHLDSGGSLSGAMLRSGLVDAVRLLVLPLLVGGTSPKTFFRAPDLASPEGVIALEFRAAQTLPQGLLLLDYDVARQRE